jgi:hypothetical protein
MESQATVNGKSAEAPPKALARSVGQFGSEALTLMELQLQLAWEDLRGFSRQAGLGLAAMVFGAACALGGLPVMVFGIAEMLIYFYGWERWVTLLALGIAAVFLSVGLIYFGVKKLFRNLATFERSKSELVCNLEWLRNLSARASKH